MNEGAPNPIQICWLFQLYILKWKNSTQNPDFEFTNITTSQIIWFTSSFPVLRRVWQPTLLQMYKHRCSATIWTEKKVLSIAFPHFHVWKSHTNKQLSELEIIFSQHEIISLKSAFIYKSKYSWHLHFKERHSMGCPRYQQNAFLNCKIIQFF